MQNVGKSEGQLCFSSHTVSENVKFIFKGELNHISPPSLPGRKVQLNSVGLLNRCYYDSTIETLIIFLCLDFLLLPSPSNCSPTQCEVVNLSCLIFICDCVSCWTLITPINYIPAR